MSTAEPTRRALVVVDVQRGAMHYVINEIRVDGLHPLESAIYALVDGVANAGWVIPDVEVDTILEASEDTEIE